MRLTQTIRNNIRAAILKHKFEKMLAEAQVESAKAGDALHAKMFPVNTWNKTHKELLHWRIHGRIQHGRDFTSVCFSKEMPVPISGPIVVPDELKSYFDACYDCKRASDQIYNMQNNARNEIAQVLLQFNTSEQLKKGWPEAAPFLPPEPVKTKELVVIPKGLNKKLNLPV